MTTLDVPAQKQSLKERLVGTWTLLSWEQRKGDGDKVERYGASPKGVAFFDAGGRYIITVMRSDRAKYASNALWQGILFSEVSPFSGVLRKWARPTTSSDFDPERSSPFDPAGVSYLDGPQGDNHLRHVSGAVM